MGIGNFEALQLFKSREFSEASEVKKVMNTMRTSNQVLEHLSAMVDGELAKEEFAGTLQACQQDDAALVSWNNYLLIGDALRSPAPVMRSVDTAFMARFKERLALEPSLDAGPAGNLVLPVGHGPEIVNTDVILARDTTKPASNDSSFRWKLIAGFASLTAVLAVAWNASGLAAPDTGPQIAQGAAVQQVLVASSQGPMVRDARLEELLAAHKQLGGGSALQVPSGFLRNATFETPPSAGR